MSMRCRISKLDIGLKSKIVALLYANGCAKEDWENFLGNTVYKIPHGF